MVSVREILQATSVPSNSCLAWRENVKTRKCTVLEGGELYETYLNDFYDYLVDISFYRE